MRASVIVTMAASLLAGSAFAQYTSPSNPPSAVEAPKTDQAPAASTVDKAPPASQPSTQNRIPPAAEGPQNPAVRTTDGNTAAAPVAGANSFTEGEAKSRIEARGFTNVTDLMKDDQGIWRGKAQREGRNVSVALDYQGNVFGEPS
jgi:hypothetical protein